MGMAKRNNEAFGRWPAGFSIALAVVLSLPAAAQDRTRPPGERTFSSGLTFVEISGEELFANVCQGCHMPGGVGAVGAGSYPALASNKNLEASGYPIELVVNGRRGMPPFGKTMTDDQIAAVVNYVRTHFGNKYEDTISASDVKAARR
jgi:mono/diheme cytochrome c family protein